ncbi:MAG: type-F conjugative transfer system secretin TraK [Nitrospiraceae bacterium]|nr:type-F conjugative transfer system secretin TraK [Nitrospiraceae bacterium]
MRIKALAFSFSLLLILQAGSALAADKTAPAGPAVANTPSATRQLAAPAQYSSIPEDSLAVVPPEIATPVYLSSSDINRIVCPSYIKDVIYSKEKGLTVKIEGRNAFVKFLVTKEGNKDDYSTTPTELYVLCGKDTYNLIALPKRIPSRTVTLSGGDSKASKNASFFDGMPFEKKILSIIKSVYTENIPDSFTVKDEDRPFNLYKGLKLTLIKTVRIEGEGLRVKEFTAWAAENMELSEKDFLKTEITSGPVAIAIDKHRLSPGETARVLIVERVTDEGGN